MALGKNSRSEGMSGRVPLSMAQFPPVIAPADPEGSFPLSVAFGASVTHEVIPATVASLPQRGERGWETPQPLRLKVRGICTFYWAGTHTERGPV